MTSFFVPIRWLFPRKFVVKNGRIYEDHGFFKSLI